MRLWTLQNTERCGMTQFKFRERGRRVGLGRLGTIIVQSAQKQRDKSIKAIILGTPSLVGCPCFIAFGAFSGYSRLGKKAFSRCGYRRFGSLSRAFLYYQKFKKDLYFKKMFIRITFTNSS